MRARASPVPVSQALQDRGGCLASASDGVERRLDRPLRVVEPPGKLVAVIADDLGAVFGQQPAETDGLDQARRDPCSPTRLFEHWRAPADLSLHYTARVNAAVAGDGAVLRRLREKIRDVPDFPKEGILFKDITTLLQDAQAFREAVDLMAATYRDQSVELVVGVESRGFIFGGALAYLLGAGFIPVRKEGKLPHQKIAEAYALEYGSAVLEIHKDAIRPGQPVVIVDDLLATGGTARTTASLVQQLGGKVVGISFLIELKFLKGAENLTEYNVVSHLKF